MMHTETIEPNLSSDYFAAGALIYNVGLLSIGRADEYMLDQRGSIAMKLRQLHADKLSDLGIAYEQSLSAPPGLLLGSLHTEDFRSVLTQTKGSIVASRDISTLANITAEIAGHHTDPKVKSVKVLDFRRGQKTESVLGQGEAAQRIGANVLSRVLNDFHHRVMPPRVTV